MSSSTSGPVVDELSICHFSLKGTPSLPAHLERFTVAPVVGQGVQAALRALAAAAMGVHEEQQIRMEYEAEMRDRYGDLSNLFS